VGGDHRAHVVLEGGAQFGRVGGRDEGAVEEVEHLRVVRDLRVDVRAVVRVASELLQRGERVLSTARTKGNFAYKGVM